MFSMLFGDNIAHLDCYIMHMEVDCRVTCFLLGRGIAVDTMITSMVKSGHIRGHKSEYLDQ